MKEENTQIQCPQDVRKLQTNNLLPRNSLEGKHVSLTELKPSDWNCSVSFDSPLSPDSVDPNLDSKKNEQKSDEKNQQIFRESIPLKKKVKEGRIRSVRIFYAVPDGKFQWKTTFLTLTVPYDETDGDNNSDGEHSQDSCFSDDITSMRCLHNQVLGWVSNVSSLLKGMSIILLMTCYETCL